jgi:hypothetical protein
MNNISKFYKELLALDELMKKNSDKISRLELALRDEKNVNDALWVRKKEIEKLIA